MKMGFVTVIALTAFLVPKNGSAATTSGFDTTNGVDFIVGVNGTEVGDWSLSQLTMMGGLRMGYDNTACSSAYEGSLRYNTNIHNYEFCNGTIWAPLGQSDPSGEVAFFLANSCPSGWVPSDGINGTVDMRGEFPRGLDNGRGVDPGRGLGSWEDATGIGQVIEQAAFIQFWNPDMQEWYGGNTSRAGLNGYVNNQVMFKVRPRNVALLACEKS